MMKQIKKWFYYALGGFYALLPQAAFAQAPTPSPLPGGSLINILTQIVNAVAGLAGIIAVAVVVYGGFQYFTGSAEEGQGTVVNGLVGLAIILLAFILVQFVVDALGA